MSDDSGQVINGQPVVLVAFPVHVLKFDDLDFAECWVRGSIERVSEPGEEFRGLFTALDYYEAGDVVYVPAAVQSLPALSKKGEH